MPSILANLDEDSVFVLINQGPAVANLTLHLFRGPLVPSPQTTLEMLEEAIFPGYRPKGPKVWKKPVRRGPGEVEIESEWAQWEQTKDGGPFEVTGMFLTASQGGIVHLLAAQRFEERKVLRAKGDGLRLQCVISATQSPPA